MKKEKMNKEKKMQMYDIQTMTRTNKEQKMMITKNQETIPLLYYLQVFLQQIAHLSPLLNLVVQFLPQEWCHLA